jgi:hypothetical protein
MSEVIGKPLMTADAMIENYVKLRDRKKEVEARHKVELEPYNKLLDELEGWMLEALNDAGLQAMNSPHGTAYKSVRTSSKVTDWAAALAFIRANEAWDLLEARVSKLAAQAIIEETNHPIPGVDTSSEVVINVRRASASAGK